MWLPILDVTGELEAIDVERSDALEMSTDELEIVADEIEGPADLEILDLEAARLDLDRELTGKTEAFWSTALTEFEAAVATVVVPVVPVETASNVTLIAPDVTPEPPTPEGAALLALPTAPAPAESPVVVPVVAPVEAPTAPAAPATESRAAARPALISGAALAGLPLAAPPAVPLAAPATSTPEIAVAPITDLPETGPAGDLPGAALEPHPAILHRADILARRRSLKLRRRAITTALVVAVLAVFAAISPKIIGASTPQRDVTLTVDGRTYSLTTRVDTVGGVLGVTAVALGPGDRTVPALGTALRQGLPILVLRAFPVDVDVDGKVRTVRTTQRGVGALRRELHVAPSLVRSSPARRLAAGSSLVLRTPHSITLQVDGKAFAIRRAAALDVAAMLTLRHVKLGARDQVVPALDTPLTDGMVIRVVRLADNQVTEQVAVPFGTQTRDDPTLPVGQTRVLQTGTAGVERVLFNVTKRDDGVELARTRVNAELLTPPTPQIVLRGTKPNVSAAGPAVPLSTVLRHLQSGRATWYGTGPGPGTCAHLHLPMGTIVTIRYAGRSAQCRVADRGPMAYTGRIIDLSPDVFKALAPLGTGVLSVELLVAG